jgi:hypothetical protein
VTILKMTLIAGGVVALFAAVAPLARPAHTQDSVAAAHVTVIQRW